MRKITTRIGVKSTLRNPQAPIDEQVWDVECDISDRICGPYGISCVNTDTERRIYVEVPDWVVPSKKWNWELSRPGYKSKSGSDDLCFIVCRAPAKVTVDLPGRINHDEFINKALSGGLELVYPGDNGEMLRMDLTYRTLDIGTSAFNMLWDAAVESDDRDQFVSDWGISSIFGADPDTAPDVDTCAAYACKVWDVAHMTIRNLRDTTGLSQANFAKLICTPTKTVINWELRNTAAPYIRLLIARQLGII